MRERWWTVEGCKVVCKRQLAVCYTRACIMLTYSILYIHAADVIKVLQRVCALAPWSVRLLEMDGGCKFDEETSCIVYHHAQGKSQGIPTTSAGWTGCYWKGRTGRRPLSSTILYSRSISSYLVWSRSVRTKARSRWAGGLFSLYNVFTSFNVYYTVYKHLIPKKLSVCTSWAGPLRANLSS